MAVSARDPRARCGMRGMRPASCRWRANFDNCPTCGGRCKVREAEFWARVDKSGSCWVWTGTRWTNGYGQISLDNKHVLTHRLAWRLTYGEIPDGLWVLHRCDNRPCVRPNHLFLGTCSDNQRDAAAKGRLWMMGPDPRACPAGHLFDETNTYFYPPPRTHKRMCRTCHRGKRAARNAALDAQAPA